MANHGEISVAGWTTRLLGVPWRQAHRILPGLALAAGVMLLSGHLAGVLGRTVLRLQGIDPAGKASPISGIIVAIVLGILITNLLGSRQVFRPGLDFGIKKALRLGIILVGLKLSFIDVLRLGEWGVPVVATVIVTALVLAVFLARRIGVSDQFGTLTAAATGICGVTAAVATAPVINANDREVAYTVANVTLFGILAMFSYPYIGHALFEHAPAAAGMFLGTAIHETGQVLGAALSYKEIFGSELAFQVATITKLTRNVFLAVMVPVFGYLYARRQGTERAQVRIVKLFPMFVLGFLGMAILRSIGEVTLSSTGAALGFWGAPDWKSFTVTVGERWSFYALGTAMACVGLNTDLKMFRGFGLKPLYLGAAVSALVGGMGLVLAAIFGPLIGK